MGRAYCEDRQLVEGKVFKKKRSRDSFSKHGRGGTHSLGHNRENAQVVFRLSSLAGTIFSCLQGNM